MDVATELSLLIAELDRIHQGSFSWSEIGMPDFVTARTGNQRHFTAAARRSTMRIAKTFHLNRPPSAIRIELEPFEKVVRQSIADLHAEGAFAGSVTSGGATAMDSLRADIAAAIARNGFEYTHHFPAWTQGIEKDSSFALGPVRFASRDSWIDRVDFPETGKQEYLNEPDANHRWKYILRAALDDRRDEASVPGLAGPIYGVVRHCPAVLTVTVLGYEREFSRKLARIVCKAALDGTSLCFQNSDFFRQQALHDERLPPFLSTSLMETKGFLWLPGSNLNRIPVLPPNGAREAWEGKKRLHAPLGAALQALVDPSDHPHPQLASRWATALDWFGEGCREPSDAVALAKVGTSLDVLSAGGRYKGILQMVSNLTGLGEKEQVMKSGEPMTLEKVIEGIYNQGRSQILHGNHHDRLKPFAVERSRAEQIANAVLLEAALRLFGYDGDGDEKAFRTMLAPGPSGA